VVGGGWPAADIRHEMLTEAVDIIRALFDGGYVSYHGDHFDVESAKLWDLPDEPVRIGMAISGRQSAGLAGSYADLAIATEPKADLLAMFDEQGGAGKPRIGQVAVCYDPDRDAAVARAHEQFRWFGLGWKVNSELPGPASFDSASTYVRPEDVAGAIACGPDVAEHVDKIRAYVDAGFTHVALVQVGGEQQESFINWSEAELLPALRQL
jgi:G6PDH family F420-dependent oxidoreductase